MAESRTSRVIDPIAFSLMVDRLVKPRLFKHPLTLALPLNSLTASPDCLHRSGTMSRESPTRREAAPA